jgi:glycosyltransferase involved in cell wall biosynthesis
MNNTKPEVSVVIPCYNGERFVADAIESVLVQTRGEPEVIVVDDGSSDGSVGVVERYTSGGRVRLFRHESNKGIAAARNTGIRNSSGRFVGLLDQDDLWCEDKLAYQLDIFGRDGAGEVGVVFGDVEVRDIDTRKRHGGPAKPPDNVERLDADGLLSNLFSGNFVPTATVLIRRECFDEVGMLDEEVRSGSDDFELLVRLAQRYRFARVPRFLAIRRMHGGNYTNPELMVPEALRILERTVAERPAIAPVVPRARSHLLCGLASDLHVKHHRMRAFRAYWESIKARPGNFRSIAGLVLCASGRVGDWILAAFRKLKS